MSGWIPENAGLADVFGAVAGITPSVPAADTGLAPQGMPPEADSLKTQEPGRDTAAVLPESRTLGAVETPPTPSPSSVTPHKKSATKPFSIRLTASEREELERCAGDQPLGTYIRRRLLDGQAEKRRPQRRPRPDDQQIALVLAELGRSRLSSNLNQLAKAAHTGTLGTSAEVERELMTACTAIASMRDTLVAALGLRPEGGS